MFHNFFSSDKIQVFILLFAFFRFQNTLVLDDKFFSC